MSGPEVLMSDGAIKRQGDSLVAQGAVCSLALFANQSVTGSTWTDINLSKVADPYVMYDTSTKRFAPKIAGYYRITGCLMSNMNSNGQVLLAVMKNNAMYRRMAQHRNTSLNSLDITAEGSCLVYMNGTTDYLQFQGYSEQTLFEGNSTGEYTYVDIELVGYAPPQTPVDRMPFDLVNATSVNLPVDSSSDKLWIVEFDLSAVFNATVYVRPNGSTLACAEVRKETRIQTGPVQQEADGVSLTSQGARLINNLGAGGLTVATGRLQMPARSYGNGERSCMVESAWEQSIGSSNYLAGIVRTGYRMGQYNAQITYLQVIADQASAMNGTLWLTRK